MSYPPIAIAIAPAAAARIPRRVTPSPDTARSSHSIPTREARPSRAGLLGTYGWRCCVTDVASKLEFTSTTTSLPSDARTCAS